MARLVGRRRRQLDEQVEQGAKIGARCGEVECGRARLGVGVDDGEVDLAIVRAEIDEQLVYGVEDLADAGIRAVDVLTATTTGRCRAMAFWST